MPNSKHILFFHLGLSSFVQADLKTLQKHHHVEEYYFKPRKGAFKLISGIQILYGWILQFFWVLARLPKADLMFCWFSDYHGVIPALLSKMSGIPLITVLGGVDSVIIRELNYGILQDPSRKRLGEMVLRRSALLLPVSETLISSNPVSKYWPESYPNGIHSHFSNLKTPYHTLPTGYDPDFWNPGPVVREKIVTTVAVMNTPQRVLVKGLDLFLQCSRILNDFEFRVVGLNPELEEQLRKQFDAGGNVRFMPRVPLEDLRQLYSESSVYAQLSRTEGLPNVLCEAMMCGCVPVGSPVFGIPEAIGDYGFVAEQPDPVLISELISKAHEQAEELRTGARDHIIRNFSSASREKALLEIIEEQTAYLSGSNSNSNS